MRENAKTLFPRRESLLRKLAAALAAAVLTVSLCAGCGRGEEARRRAAAVRMADFILSLQGENGAIPDAADADTVNEDSNMEYALMALAAACRSTGRAEYLAGLERGIVWLARAEVLEGGPWDGSWWYVYDRDGGRLPAPPETGAADIRGVDSTSALFVYLLYLDQQCAGSRALADRYRAHAAAALDFLLTKSRTEAGFTAGFFEKDGAGVWRRCGCCYAADQGDVWLGLQAGALLYGNAEYAQAADLLREKVPEVFFSGARRRYCAGVEDGRQDWSEQGFAPIQSQGFLPWLWGDTEQNRASVGWLRERMAEVRPEEYFLSAAFLGLGEQGLGGAFSDSAAAWLLENGLDPASGGVYDSPRDHTETVNTAAFCALALLGCPTGF